MIDARNIKAVPAAGIRLRPIALPAEHGGWSLLLEPIALGLLLTPSATGLLLSLAAIGAFLTRQPLKLTLSDLMRKRLGPRTELAKRFAVLYVFLTAVFLIAACATAQNNFWLPLLLSAPLFAVQLVFDSKGQSRALVAELTGSMATGAFATAIAISGGWPRGTAFALWILVAARAVPTILFLRARLRLLHRKPASTTLVYTTQSVALIIVIVTAWFGLAPWLAVAANVLLLARAIFSFLPSNKQVTAKLLGVRELILGALTVFMIVLGYQLSW